MACTRQKATTAASLVLAFVVLAVTAASSLSTRPLAHQNAIAASGQFATVPAARLDRTVVRDGTTVKRIFGTALITARIYHGPSAATRQRYEVKRPAIPQALRGTTRDRAPPLH